MGLGALDAAISGLRNSNAQLSVISANVSNATTEGYSRKIMPQEAQVIAGRTAGVLSGTIVRQVDFALERDLWTQTSISSAYDVQIGYLESVQQLHGSPDSGINIAEQLTELKNDFALLSDAPEDAFLRQQTVDQAVAVATKINDFAEHVRTLRNDVQNEMTTAVPRINELLEQIATLNGEIAYATSIGTSTASLADSRSIAIKELSEYLEIDTFTRGDGVIVVQAQGGIDLADQNAYTLYFNPPALGPTTAYEANTTSSLGIYVGGNPATNPGATEITTNNLGGKFGGLITLRDETLPAINAQIDEFSHKLARRFEAQGLRLFTDSGGLVPADTAPNTSTPTAVPYVGFALEIQVNLNIIQDTSLLQQGTYGDTLAAGSNEVISRVLDYSFGDVNYQLAANSTASTSVDIQADATGSTTLQDWLGLQSENEVSGYVDLTSYASISDMLTAGGLETFGTDDNFEIVFDDDDLANGPYTVEIDLSSIAAGGTNAGQDLITAIEADGDWANIQSDYNASVSLNENGELVISSRSDVTIQSASSNGLGSDGFAFLGLNTDTYEATDPYFDIYVGENDPVRVSIDPADTETDLLAALNAIDGVAAAIDSNGFLSIRPGGSFTNPDYGGTLRITAGDFTTSSATLTGTASGRSSIDDGVNIISALFGTYSDAGGGIMQNESPINDVSYQSEISEGSGTYLGFRTENLGTLANISTGVINATSLIDYAQKMISSHSQSIVRLEGKRDDADVLQNLYNDQLTSESGVNIDQEMASLIVVQNAYAASAQIVRALEESFDELLRLLS